MDRIAERIADHLGTFWKKLMEFIPDALIIILIIASGFIIASLLARLLHKGFRAVRFDAWSEQTGFTTALRKAGFSVTPTRFVGSFLYWFVVVLFFMAGFATLGYEVTDALVSVFFLYLPRFFSAVIIIVLGYFIANFLARAALIAAVNAGIEYSRLISESVRVFLFILASAMALEQLAIAPKIVFAAFAIFFGTIGLALAIAFGAAGKEYAKKAMGHLFSKKEDGRDIDQL
jgi:small-conductance mechanosensitive channel